MSNMENLLSFLYCQAPINHMTPLLPTAANSKITLDGDQAFISIDLLRGNPKFMNLNHSTLQEHLTLHYQNGTSPPMAITFYSLSLHLFQWHFPLRHNASENQVFLVNCTLPVFVFSKTTIANDNHLCPLDSSCLGLPRLSALSFRFRVPLGLCLSLPSTHWGLETLSRVLTCFPSLRDHCVLLPYVQALENCFVYSVYCIVVSGVKVNGATVH